MIEVKGDPFASFGLDGEPACKATGSEFGPDFANDWICLGLDIRPNGVITGSGIATSPLTPAITARFDWSNNGTAAGLLPDYSQDIHFYPVAAPARTNSATTDASDAIKEAIRYEEAGSEAASKHDWTSVNQDLNNKGIGARESLSMADNALTLAVSDGEGQGDGEDDRESLG